MRKPRQFVKALLKSMVLPTKHMMNDNPELVAALRYFLELRAAGDPSTRVHLAWFYREKLRDQFNGPKSFCTVRAYIRDVMKLDPKTGKTL